RLAAERSAANVDLLFISTLRPRAIIWGKFFSAVVLMLVIFSACAPFMTFTYLLRGIDIPTILLVLAIDFVAVVAAIQLAIFIAVIPGGWVIKAFFGFMGLVGLFYMFVPALMGSIALVEMGLWASLDSWDFWGPAGVVAVVTLALVGLVFFWSVAIVNPPSANRALPVRLYLLGAWLVTGAGFGGWGYWMSEAMPVFIWMVASAMLFCLQLMIAINEREQWAPRVARTIPRRWWLRLPAFLFYSGSAGGVTFAVLMVGLTLVAGQLGAEYFPTWRGMTDIGEVTDIVVLIGLY